MAQSTSLPPDRSQLADTAVIAAARVENQLVALLDGDVDDLPIRTGWVRRLLGLLALLTLLLILIVASIAIGAREIAPGTVVQTLLGLSPTDDFDRLVIVNERLPRTLLGLVVGVCLGASGVIFQAVTRNPLADPGVLGIELGAALAVVIAIVYAGVTGAAGYFWFAFAGAMLTALFVYVISRATSATSDTISLVIVGAATAAMLAAAINLLIVRDEAAYAHFRFWSVGQLVGRADVIGELWPFALLGVVLALTQGAQLNALNLGDDIAAGLGVNVKRSLLAAAAIGVLLCAAATAAVGPVAFVGLVGAHIARMIVGTDHRWVLPYGMLCGAVMLLAADVAGRIVPGYGEVQVGIMTAVVGTPFFIYLARRRRTART
ncbi:MAG: iron ABC transporter permease [Nakamurella sp.]